MLTKNDEIQKKVENIVNSYNFRVPVIVRNTIEDTETALAEDGEFGPFLNWVDTLDNVCKECYVTGAITKNQWNLIMKRYLEML